MASASLIRAVIPVASANPVLAANPVVPISNVDPMDVGDFVEFVPVVKIVGLPDYVSHPMAAMPIAPESSVVRMVAVEVVAPASQRSNAVEITNVLPQGVLQIALVNHVDLMAVVVAADCVLSLKHAIQPATASRLPVEIAVI